MNANRNLHRFAIFVAACTLLLIFAGGLVTSTGSGLAVPDWPLSFGQVFPQMKGGVAYEHGHRMVATFVGFLTVVLAVWLWKRESRRWIRRLGFLSVVAVIAQGILGGATVLHGLPLLLSVGHAALAEIFVCLTVAIAVSTSPQWERDPALLDDAGSPSARTLGVLALAMIYIQIVFGALMRHTGGGLSIPDFPLSYGRLIPPFFTGPILFNYAHRIAGLLLIIVVIWFSVRAISLSRMEGSLRFPAWTLLLSLLLQVSLGAVTIWSRKAVLPTTLHVVCGALTLASCLWLAMTIYRVSPRSEPRRVHAVA